MSKKATNKKTTIEPSEWRRDRLFASLEKYPTSKGCFYLTPFIDIFHILFPSIPVSEIFQVSTYKGTRYQYYSESRTLPTERIK